MDQPVSVLRQGFINIGWGDPDADEYAMLPKCPLLAREKVGSQKSC